MIDNVINVYLPRLFDWVIETSIMASILVGIILCVRALLRNKLTPRWQYLLWMILVVRLILPCSPGSSFSIYSILLNGYESITSEQSQSIDSTNKQHLHETTNSGIKAVTDEERFNILVPPKIVGNKKEVEVSNELQGIKSISVYSIALYAWLIGVIVFGFTTYLANRRLRHYIKLQPAITDKKVISIFESCKKSMSIQKNIPLLLAGKIQSPTVFGFFQPRVLLSSDQINLLNEQQLRHIFLHELAHIKRRDIGLNWLMHYLLILNWFNPIIWIAHVCMREDQELACDAYALTFMLDEEKIPYGYTIISLLEHYAKYYYPVPSLANLSRNKRTLMRRISMIKRFKKKSYRWSVLGIMAVAVVASVSLLNAAAEGSNENKKEKISGNETIKADAKGQSNKNLANVDVPKNQANMAAQTIKNNQSDKISEKFGDFPYIVYDQHYYKKGPRVDQSKVGSKIGEVKRIGEWEIIKDGDSNEVPPGPIYSVVDKDPKEVIAAKQWSNRDIYVLFERETPVIQPEKSTIFSSKNDPEEVLIAMENVRKDSSAIYEFKDRAGLELFFISYDPSHKSTVFLSYKLPEVEQGMLSVKQYPKHEVPENSAFIRHRVFITENNRVTKEKNKEWKEPVLKESFTVNGIDWGQYETVDQEDVYRGEQQNLYFEISTQGEIDLNSMIELLSSFEPSTE